MLASILDASLVKTASFTSPHLLKEQDSIIIGGGSVNGKMVSDQDYQTARDLVKEANTLNINASRFEVLTATAFKLFSMLKIDIAVIEVGLGGTLDATNILPAPLISVLCPIGIDHVGMLGNGVDEIARHKAGIIKKGSLACVIAKQPYQAAFDVLHSIAIEQQVPVYCVKNAAKDVTGISSDYSVQVEFPSNQTLIVNPFLQGTYQLENIATACMVCSVLVDKNIIDITCSALSFGLATARNPGRLEWVNTKVYGSICIDGAHNEDGVRALSLYLSKERKKMSIKLGLPCCPIAFVVGFSSQKDHARLLQLLECKEGDIVLPVRFPEPEGMKWISAISPEEIGRSTPYFKDCQGDLELALDMIDRKVTPLIVVCGSLYLVAHFIRSIEIL